MKFPITREELQAYCPNQEREEKAFKNLLDIICRDFEQGMVNNHKSKKFIMTFTNKNLMIPPGVCSTDYKSKIIIPRLIEKLKEIFIGCDIITDPLNTYIIIEWS